MKRYINHIKETREPHERRQHALQISGVAIAAVFVVWMGTLGVRFAAPLTVATSDGVEVVNPEADTSLQAAAAASKNNKGAHLEVSTTSVYSY